MVRQAHHGSAPCFVPEGLCRGRQDKRAAGSVERTGHEAVFSFELRKRWAARAKGSFC